MADGPTFPLPLQPFRVPNFVLEKVTLGQLARCGFGQSRTFSLHELDAQTLSHLCDQFRAEVFKKAGKQDPAGEPTR